MKAHTLIGPGLDEQIYHQELARELTAAGMPHLSKPRRDLVYCGIVADTFEPDLVVADHFIPELKCLRGSFSREHLVQLFSYCKFWRLRTGMLTDFGKQSLIWKRYLYQSQSAAWPHCPPPEFVSKPGLATDTLRLIGDCLKEIGLGYRETTWKGLVKASLQAGGLHWRQNPAVQVLQASNASLPCIVVEDTCALLVIALTDGITATDRAVLQTHLRWLKLDWGMALHFGKSTVDCQFVKCPNHSDKLPTDEKN